VCCMHIGTGSIFGVCATEVELGSVGISTISRVVWSLSPVLDSIIYGEKFLYYTYNILCGELLGLWLC